LGKGTTIQTNFSNERVQLFKRKGTTIQTKFSNERVQLFKRKGTTIQTLPLGPRFNYSYSITRLARRACTPHYPDSFQT
jgi:hypothetical protein